MTQQNPSLGLNRTGIKTSPLLAAAMLDSARQFHWESVDTRLEDPEKIRMAYLKDAEPLGSVPPPLTIKGAIATGYEKLKGGHPEILIDKLGERLAFERTGVRLYRALIRKCDLEIKMHEDLNIFRLQEIADTELNHMLLIKSVMEDLGADPTATTPGADAMAVASMGLGQVLNDPRTSLGQCLEAILVAELSDTDGWALLVELCENMGHEKLIPPFRAALAEENKHVLEIRSLLKHLTLRSVKL